MVRLVEGCSTSISAGQLSPNVSLTSTSAGQLPAKVSLTSISAGQLFREAGHLAPRGGDFNLGGEHVAVLGRLQPRRPVGSGPFVDLNLSGPVRSGASGDFSLSGPVGPWASVDFSPGRQCRSESCFTSTSGGPARHQGLVQFNRGVRSFGGPRRLHTRRAGSSRKLRRLQPRWASWLLRARSLHLRRWAGARPRWLLSRRIGSWLSQAPRGRRVAEG